MLRSISQFASRYVIIYGGAFATESLCFAQSGPVSQHGLLDGEEGAQPLPAQDPQQRVQAALKSRQSGSSLSDLDIVKDLTERRTVLVVWQLGLLLICYSSFYQKQIGA